jgi:hypothetical protein
VLDAVLESVLEAGCHDGTAGTDLASAIHPHAVAGEEHLRGIVPAVAGRHPRGIRRVVLRSLIHDTLLSSTAEWSAAMNDRWTLHRAVPVPEDLVSQSAMAWYRNESTLIVGVG